MKVIAFHTGGRYVEEAALLKASLDRVKMDYFITEFNPVKDWDRAVAMKPRYIADCLKRFKEPLLMVDVDAFFHSNCDAYFDGIQSDFGVHYFQGPKGGYDQTRNDNHLLSGTTYWNNTPCARLLLAAWQLRNEEKQAKGNWEGGGQANLAEVLAEELVAGLKTHLLPGRFCWVFDKSWAYPKGCVPVIEHLIASRENRGMSVGTINESRQQRILELKEVVR